MADFGDCFEIDMIVIEIDTFFKSISHARSEYI